MALGGRRPCIPEGADRSALVVGPRGVRLGVPDALPLENGESRDIVSVKGAQKRSFWVILENHRVNPSPSKSNQENRTHM